MKTLFVIIMSAVLAAVICMILISTEIINFKKIAVEPLKTVIKKTEPVLHKIQNNILKTPVKDNPESLPEIDRQEIISKEAVDFLQAAVEKGIDDVEEKFKKFLKKDQNLDDDKVQKFLKMSFWKNFVTLQNMESTDRDKIKLEFARELELKKAGFAAKGIILMKSEIESAEKELEIRLKVED